MKTYQLQAALDVAVTLTPVRRYLNDRGIISLFQADTTGIQMRASAFYEAFPEYTIEDDEYGGSRRAVGVYEGQRFFTLIDMDPVKIPPIKWEDDE